jgi:HEAT repeat protein
VHAGELEVFVEQLAVPHRAQRAFWHLVLSGAGALPAVRAGLRDENADVRRYCVKVLDHVVDEDSFPELVRMVGDSDPRVRSETLHALSCDRCKATSCRPSKVDVLPVAISLLRNDPDNHVRTMAAGLIGRWVHSDAAAAAALVEAADSDRCPAVRKKARWYAPGGAIYERTRPKPPRR